jgi:putative transposase
VLENQKHYRSSLRKLKRLQRSFSRKQPGSRNRSKARHKVARQHHRVACAREDVLHKFTTDLTRRYHLIGMEDLHVKGMLKNRRLAMSLSDAAFGRFKTLLQAKAKHTGTILIEVGRFFPSSKRCHRCHHRRDDLTLSERWYVCCNPACRWEGDRDDNGSQNLLQEAIRLYRPA